MKQTLIFALFALVLVTGSAAGETARATAQSVHEWGAQIERVVATQGVLEDGREVAVTTSKIVRLEGHQFECTFSATCNADGTIDLTTNGCTPSAHSRILKWVIEICSI